MIEKHGWEVLKIVVWAMLSREILAANRNVDGWQGILADTIAGLLLFLAVTDAMELIAFLVANGGRP